LYYVQQIQRISDSEKLFERYKFNSHNHSEFDLQSTKISISKLQELNNISEIITNIKSVNIYNSNEEAIPVYFFCEKGNINKSIIDIVSTVAIGEILKEYNEAHVDFVTLNIEKSKGWWDINEDVFFSFSKEFLEDLRSILF